MFSYTSHIVVGISGREYPHKIYVLKDINRLNKNGIYIVYRDDEIVVEWHKYKAIYVGKAIEETIAERFSGGHGERTGHCFEENGAHFIGVIDVPEDMTADAVEKDLIKGLAPECNIQHREKEGETGKD